MKEKLAKLLARAGIASRRKAESLILDGKVSVDGHVIRNVAERADPSHQVIAFGNRRLTFPQQKTVILLHKPRNTVTSRSDPEGRPTVYDLLRPEHRRLFHVGRLDFASEGLLLLTDDGEMAQHLAHPRFEVPKVYQVKLQGRPDPARLEPLKKGIRSEGETLTAVRLRILKENPANFWMEVEVREGKTHEIRRLCEAVQYKVLRLKRTRFGPFHLGDLPSGKWRSALVSEIRGALKGLRICSLPLRRLASA